MKSRILLVEDDQSVAYMLEMALSQAGFEVQIAGDGLEGWQAFQDQRPDLVLSDIKMPRMDGMQLLSQIRTADPAMDVVILTGHGDLPTAIKAVELGAYRYLEKPINQITDLIDTVDKALERRRLMHHRELIDRISRDLSRRLSLDDFLDRFVELVLSASPAIDAVLLSLYDADEDCLVFKRAHGFADNECMLGQRGVPSWRLGDRPPEIVQPIRLQAATYDEQGLQQLSQRGVPEPLLDLIRQCPTFGVLGIPIVSKEIIIGSLAVFNFESAEAMDDQLKGLLTTLCNQVGLNMRNATLFADLRAQTGRLEAVLDSSADGLVVFDPSGQVIMTNPRYREMFSVGEQSRAAAQRELSVILKLALEREQRADFIFTLDHPTSDEQTVLEVYAAQVCQGDEPIGIVANLRDVTLLRSRERQRSDMLRLAKHEVGTPLAFIDKQARNMLDLKEQMSERDRIVALTGISQQAKEVSKLVDETLSYSKLKELLLIKKQTRVDLSQLAQELAHEATLLAEENRHQFSSQIEPDLQVMGTYHILKRAFRNLLDNARKFTPAGGRISLNAWREDNSVQVEVADNGIGIVPDEQGQIFEPYYRGGDCSGTAGTGLGLSIVQEVVNAHRGKISVHSAEGEGSRFRVTLLALTPSSQNATTGCQPE